MVPSPHDLTAQPALRQPRQAAEVHRGLRVAVSDQHTPPAGHQGKYMSWPAQLLRPCGGVRTPAAGIAPFLRRDPGGGVRVVDGHRKGGAVVIGVHLYHLFQAKPGGYLAAHGGADQPLGVHRHKIDILCGGKLGRADHVSLVLPVRIVDRDDDPARPQLLQRLLHRAIGMLHRVKPPLMSHVKIHSGSKSPG